MALTKEQAMTARNFEHATVKNKDGTPLRARRNGETKTWVTRPDEWSLPVKHGLKNCFRITEQDAEDWNVA